MRHEDVGTRSRHRRRLVVVEGVGRRQEVTLVREPDHVDLAAVAHAGLLQPGAKHAVDQSDRREVLHAAEADPAELVKEDGHQAERIGPAHAREHRSVVHDREHLTRHVDDDLVRVAVQH